MSNYNTGLTAGTFTNGGYDAEPGRSYYRFDLASSILQGSVVSSASLNQYVSACIGGDASRFYCNQHNYDVDLHKMDGYWDSTSTYTTLSGLTDAATFDSSHLPAFYLYYDATGCHGCGYQAWSGLGPSVQNWINDPTTNNGFSARLRDETANIGGPYWAYRYAAFPGPHPYLSVTYTPPTTGVPIAGVGQQPFYTMTSRQLTDRADIHVNVASGNLLYHTSDLHVKGTGLDMNVDRWYNSKAYRRTTVGAHWSSTVGDDVILVGYYDGSFIFRGPSGYEAQFLPKTGGGWTTPPGMDADLTTINGGWQLSFHDSGLRYTFEGHGFLASEVDRNGNTLTFLRNTDSTVSYILDTQGRYANFSYTGPAYTITIAGDSSGRVTRYTYDEYEDLIQAVDAAGKVTTYKYDGNYNLAQVLLPDGKTVDLQYDSSHRVTCLKYTTGTAAPDCVRGANIEVNTVQYNAGSTVVTDGNLHNTTYTYDSSGKVTQAVDALSQQQSATYSPDNKVQTSTDASTGVTTNTYEPGTNNLTASQQPTSGGLTGAKSTLGYTDPAHIYSPTSVGQPQGNSFTYHYDTPGNLDRTTSQLAASNMAVLTYNPNGTVATSTDGNRNVTTFGYDTVGNLTTITPPLPLLAETFGYDGLSRLTSATDGKHQLTQYSYDTLDRLTQVQYSDGSLTKQFFDASGRRYELDDNTGKTTFGFDLFNNQISKAIPASVYGTTNTAQTIGYTYDAENNLLTATDTGGTVTYGPYDAVNQLKVLTEPNGNQTSYGYDPKGNRTTTTYPNGVTNASTYDGSNRLTHTRTTGIGGAVITDLTYTYVAPGNGQDTNRRFSVTDAAGNKTTNTYDQVDRLTEARTTNTLNVQIADYQYTYDGNGNRLTQTVNGVTGAHVPNGANQDSAAVFDPNGNQLTSLTGAVATYNVKNQTDTVTPSGGTSAALVYTGLGQSERVEAGPTYFASTKLGTAIQYDNVVTAGGLLVSDSPTYYTHDSGGQLGEERTPGGNYYYVYDGLGSVVALTDAAGNVVKTYQYDPYGNSTGTTGSVANPWQYAGQYHDTSALYKMGARYTDTTLGRWTQQDAIVAPFDPHQSNRYIYVGDDPVNYIDLSGTISFDVHFKFHAGVGFEAGVKFGDGGVHPYVGAGVGAGSGLGASVSPAGRSDDSKGFGVSGSGCVVGGCESIDQNGNFTPNASAGGETNISGDVTYTF